MSVSVARYILALGVFLTFARITRDIVVPIPESQYSRFLFATGRLKQAEHIMPLHELLVPPALFILSSFIFLIAIQFSSRARVLISLLVFGTAIISLYTSRNLPQHEAMNSLWALLNCVWILHAAHTLFLDEQRIPRGVLPWTSAYKIWANPQGRTNWNDVSSKPSFKSSSSKPSTRRRFATRRFLEALGCWLLQLCIFEPFIFLSIYPTSEDFAPPHQVLFRRLLWPSTGPEFTRREIQIRLLTSVFWIWQGFLMLHTCHVLLSIFFVTILRIDTPEEWPPLFDSPMQAYSVRQFWSKFWHRMTVPGSTSSGKLVARWVGGIVPGSRLEKPFIAFWTFLLSGMYHAIADWQAGEACVPSADLLFFIANFGAAAIETIAVPGIIQVGKKRNNILCRHILSDRGGKLIGVVRVLGFFFWVVPKWQYPKMHLKLLKAEDVPEWFTLLVAQMET